MSKNLSSPVVEKRYLGIANPSGAVALTDNYFIVADDEDNILRIYDQNKLDAPLQTIMLSKVFPGKIDDGEDMEVDIESTAEIDGNYFWLGSHSTSRKGKSRPARHRLLATTIKPKANEGFEILPVGNVYTNFIDDLLDDPRFDTFDFDEARKTAPKSIGGLSIEGLAATPNKTLLVGFRNPLSGGKKKKGRLLNAKALLVELLNPTEILQGKKAQFADPRELDLGGFGIREITWRKGQEFLIVAGPYHENLPTEDFAKEPFRLYQWFLNSGELNYLKAIDLTDLNVEAAFFYPGNDNRVQLLSDDGKLGMGDGFRSRTLDLE